MIKRQWFISVKIAHNNGTGNYSYYNGVMNVKSWLKPDGDDLVIACRELGRIELDNIIDRDICDDDVEILALNRV